jgi:hypothetical protein
MHYEIERDNKPKLSDADVLAIMILRLYIHALDDCSEYVVRTCQVLKCAARIRNMTITISLPPEVEESVKSQANKEGKRLEDYVESLVEEGSRRRDRIDLLAEKSFDEILAPFRQSVEDSGMSDEALDALFTEARKEASRARKERA